MRPQMSGRSPRLPRPDMLIAAGGIVLPENLERIDQLHIEECERCAR